MNNEVVRMCQLSDGDTVIMSGYVYHVSIINNRLHFRTVLNNRPKHDCIEFSTKCQMKIERIIEPTVKDVTKQHYKNLDGKYINTGVRLHKFSRHIKPDLNEIEKRL